MNLSELKRLADEYSLWYRDGVAYGTLKGCYISISHIVNFDAAHWRFCIYIGCAHPGNSASLLDKAEAAAAVVRWEATDCIYGITQPLLNCEPSSLHIIENGTILQVDLLDHPDSGSLRQLRAFIENILPQITPHTSPHLCARCGRPINSGSKLSILTGKKEPDEPEAIFLPDGAVLPMHVSCAEHFSGANRKAVQQNQERLNRNLRMSFLSGVALFLFHRLISWLFSR